MSWVGVEEVNEKERRGVGREPGDGDLSFALGVEPFSCGFVSR